MNELTLENRLLKRNTLCYANNIRSCFTWCKTKTNAKMNFYTGIQTIEMFNVIFILNHIYQILSIRQQQKNIERLQQK